MVCIHPNPIRDPSEMLNPCSRQRKTHSKDNRALTMQSLATLRGTWGTESWFEETQTPSETLNPCVRRRELLF